MGRWKKCRHTTSAPCTPVSADCYYNFTVIAPNFRFSHDFVGVFVLFLWAPSPQLPDRMPRRLVFRGAHGNVCTRTVLEGEFRTDSSLKCGFGGKKINLFIGAAYVSWMSSTARVLTRTWHSNKLLYSGSSAVMLNVRRITVGCRYHLGSDFGIFPPCTQWATVSRHSHIQCLGLYRCNICLGCKGGRATFDASHERTDCTYYYYH